MPKKNPVALLHGPITAWLVLVCGLLVTALAWKFSTDQAERRLRERLDFRVQELTSSLEARVKVYEQVLWGGVGLFKASQEVARKEWKAYVDTLRLEERWPGVQGLGWAVNLTPSQKATFVAQTRAEGFEDFEVKPPGRRERYTAIAFLEPFDWRNRRAFGYDMATNDVRAAAMWRAARTGQASTSGKITLVQETDTNVQAGFLTYVPVYDRSLPQETPEQRERALKGWVYAPFRAGDLVHGILDSQDHQMELELFDGSPSPENLLYDSNNALEFKSEDFDYIRVEKLELQGRTWHLRFTVKGISRNDNSTRLPTLVATFGFIIDILLFYLITVLVNSQRRAEKLVDRRTSELERKSLELAEVNQDLVRTNEDLASFAEVASHDLQEPLRTITSFSQLLQMEYSSALDLEGEEYLHHIVKAAERMRLLLQDTLIFSRLRKASFPKERINCRQLVDSSLDSLADLLVRTQVQVHIVDDLPTLKTSPLIDSVFTNLIGNAAKYRSEPGGNIWVTAKEEDEQWTFCISDDGLGIEPEYRQKIFELFERLHPPEEYSGSGLGLAICRRIVEALGGRIWVEANEPRGSRFFFTLPHL